MNEITFTTWPKQEPYNNLKKPTLLKNCYLVESSLIHQ